MAFSRARLKPAAPLQPFEVPGFAGMRDQRGSALLPGEMLGLFNLEPEGTADRPGPYFLRPGFKRFAVSGTAKQITGSPAVAIQWYGYCTFSGGARFILISSSGIFEWDVGSVAVTQMLSAAQVTTAGGNLASFGGAVFYHGKLILTSDAAKPLAWDGTSGAGLTQLANASIGATLPTVYAAKLFFRKGVSGDSVKTIIWSEENDETTGYEAGGFNNAWLLTQTNQTPIHDLAATEDGLIVFRLLGIGAVRGQVDANFQSTATRDDISSEIRVQNMASTPWTRACVAGHDVLFFDVAGRPWKLADGRTPVPLYAALPRSAGGPTYSPIDPEPYDFNAFGGPGELEPLEFFPGTCYYDLDRRAYVFTILGAAFSYHLLFSPADDRLMTVWASSALLGAGGHAYFNGGGAGYHLKADDSGFVYWMDPFNVALTQSQYSDETSAGVGTPVVGYVLGPPAGGDKGTEYHWERADVLVEARAGLTVSLGFITSSGHKGALSAAAQTFTDAAVASPPYERRVEFGLDALGRWLRPYIQISASASSTARPGIFGYRLLGRPLPSQLGGL